MPPVASSGTEPSGPAEIAEVARSDDSRREELDHRGASAPGGVDLGGRERSRNRRHAEIEAARDDLWRERRADTRLRSDRHRPLHVLRREHGPGEHRDVPPLAQARDRRVRAGGVERHLDNPDAGGCECVDETDGVRDLPQQDDEPLRPGCGRRR